jgi:hypothetical protein
MRFFAPVILAGVFLGATAATAPQPPSDIMATVHTFFAITEGRSDVNPDTLFTSDGVVIDESAPFIWRGPHAASQWVANVKRLFVKMSVTNFKTSVGTPIEYNQTDDGAYLILPMTLSAQAKPRPFSETGTMTFTFQNAFGFWKISSAVWTTAK